MIAMLMLAINHDDIDGNDENVFVKWDQSLFADRATLSLYWFISIKQLGEVSKTFLQNPSTNEGKTFCS